MYGWAGTILDIDLSSGRIDKQPFDTDLGRAYLGGRGINSRILYQETGPGINPLSPENVLIFGTGPLGGTIAPCASRMSVTAKACLYDGLGTSNAGGFFAPELKWAGYDHLVFRGKAEEPVYLWIDDGRVELRRAQHLWGKTTFETDHEIKEELGDHGIKVVSIGPGGENLVLFASITVTKYRAAAQTGMGAVMGSKNLKAIAVRGTGKIEVFDPEILMKLSIEYTRKIMENEIYPVWSTHGTPAPGEAWDKLGILAIRNYQQTGNWEGGKSIYAETLWPYYTKQKSCHSCPIHCGHFFEIKDGPFKGERGGGLEAAALWPFGPICDNSDTASIFKIVNLANQYGLDTIECGTSIAAAMEWYEKGIITKKDTDGIALEWGNAEAIIAMIHKIAKREGFGDLMAEGAVHAAKKIGKGAEDFVSHCKGMMLSSDDPRVLKGAALSHVTGTIPAHHEDGAPMEMGGDLEVNKDEIKELYETTTLDPTSYVKEKAVVYYQNMCRIFDAVELCKFASEWLTQELGLKEVGDLFLAATGIELSPEDLTLVAERINDLERAYAIKEGMSRKDDHLVGKITKEPVQTGQYEGERLDPEKFDVMLQRYYALRGWDKKTGIPTREKLEKVGLKEVADELERMGKIPSPDN